MAFGPISTINHTAASLEDALPLITDITWGTMANKVIMTMGGSIYIGKHWRFDAVYAHFFAQSVHVSPGDAKIGRINPLNGNAPFEAVNGGTYSASADLLGVGLNYRF